MKFNPFSNLKRSVSFATVCLLLAGLVLIPACQDPADEFMPVQAEQVTDADITAAMNQAAPVMAEMLNDIEVRNLIKENALKQFDGDYDVLYKDLAIQQLRKGETFGMRFTANLAAQLGSEAEAERVINMIPRFHVAVPVNIEKWDTDAFVPSVVVNPFHLQESEYETYTTYTANGQTSALSSRVDPEFPVVALGVNERTYDDGRLKPQFLASYDDANRARVSGEQERLEAFKILNLNALEGWAAGKPEMRVDVLGARAFGSISSITDHKITTKYYKPKRNQVNNTWYTVNTYLFNWKTIPTSSTTVYGDEIKLVWVEEDSGAKFEIEFSIGGKIKIPGIGDVSVSVKPKLTFEDKDDQAGDAIVDFADSKSTIYSTGLLQFEQD